MQIQIVSFIHKINSEIKRLEDDYTKRLQGWKITDTVLKPSSKNGSSSTRLEHEATMVKKTVAKQNVLVCLDERGKHFTSVEFAQFLNKQTSPVSFIIGSADGLDQSLKQGSQLFALSKMTLPHQMAKLILIEQIYRAYSLQKNHPYHRV